MTEERAFRRNFLWVTGIHLAALGVFALVSRLQAKPEPAQVVWMDGGMLAGGESGPAPEAAEAEPDPELAEEPPEEEVPELIPPPPDPEPEVAELPIPQATPPPTPTPRPATPTPRPATPTPRPATPKPTPSKPTPPRATPKPTPKASPKPVAKSSPKPKATPQSSPKPGGTPAATAAKGASATPGKATAKGGTGSGDSQTAGGKGTGGGSGGASEFGWYFGLLRDRYYAVWLQPTSIDRTGTELVVTLKLKVKRDGTVLGSEIIHSSGNSLMDGSVMAAAEKVKTIDPLPPNLGGTSEEVEIPMNFKLDQAQ